jgi:hypothetical protein
VGGGPSYGNILVGGRPACHHYWGDEEAAVACKSLGFAGGVMTHSSKYGLVPTLYDGKHYECIGTEDSLQNCRISDYTGCNGRSYRGAGVVCR